MKASLRGHVEVVQTLITGQAVLDLKNHVSILLGTDQLNSLWVFFKQFA